MHPLFDYCYPVTRSIFMCTHPIRHLLQCTSSDLKGPPIMTTLNHCLPSFQTSCERGLQTPASSGATLRSQSISPSSPYLVFNHSFVFLKCPQSKKPLLALSGLGCGLFNTKCFVPLTPFTLCSAGLPQAKKTTPLVLFAATISMTFCVNFSQPLPACEFAL